MKIGNFDITAKHIIIFVVVLFVLMICCCGGLFGIGKNADNKNKKETNVNSDKKAADPTQTKNSTTPIETPTATATTIKTEAKKTFAEIAYEKLKSDNMINEDSIVAIQIMTDIDIGVSPGKNEDYVTHYKQVFTFSDGSKIQLCKKSSGNGNYIFMPSGTKIIK